MCLSRTNCWFFCSLLFSICGKSLRSSKTSVKYHIHVEIGDQESRYQFGLSSYHMVPTSALPHKTRAVIRQSCVGEAQDPWPGIINSPRSTRPVSWSLNMLKKGGPSFNQQNANYRNQYWPSMIVHIKNLKLYYLRSWNVGLPNINHHFSPSFLWWFAPCKITWKPPNSVLEDLFPTTWQVVISLCVYTVYITRYLDLEKPRWKKSMSLPQVSTPKASPWPANCLPRRWLFCRPRADTRWSKASKFPRCPHGLKNHVWCGFGVPMGF